MIIPKDICFAVGTYGTPAYTHLNVALLKRHHPDATVFIVNDKQGDGDTAKIAEEYSDVHYIETGRTEEPHDINKGYLGESYVFKTAITEAKKYGFKYVLKLSRRYMFDKEVLTGLCDFINKSNALTISNITYTTMCYGSSFRSYCLPIRTEVICMAVDPWYESLPYLSDLCNSEKKIPAWNGLPVEEHAFETLACMVSNKIYNKYSSNMCIGFTNAQKEYEKDKICYFGDFNIYTDIASYSRDETVPKIITHWTHQPEDYYMYSKKLKLKYSREDFNFN